MHYVMQKVHYDDDVNDVVRDVMDQLIYDTERELDNMITSSDVNCGSDDSKTAIQFNALLV